LAEFSAIPFQPRDHYECRHNGNSIVVSLFIVQLGVNSCFVVTRICVIFVLVFSYFIFLRTAD